MNMKNILMNWNLTINSQFKYYIILTELSLKEEKTQRVNVIETEKEIVSLNFKQEINGSIDGNFILGIGSVDGNINNESYFYFYTK